MKTFWLINIHPEFTVTEELTGKTLLFRNWREEVADVRASTTDEAKQVAAFTGIIEGVHYNDIVEEKGKI